MAETTPVQESKKKSKKADETAPAQVVLAAPFAYFDEDGALQSWQPGFIETDAAKVADLISRGAPLEASNV